MVSGGNLRIATDHEDYAKWIINCFLDDPRFIWQAQSKADWLTQPADHIETKYQKKNLAKSKQAVFLNFVVA
jgi:tRNA (guanine-N7-)-methyltransferase